MTIQLNQNNLNDYHRLLLFLGDSLILRQYIHTFLKYHLNYREVDLYWAKILMYSHGHTRIVHQLHKSDITPNQIVDFAKEECDRLLWNIDQMYMHDRQLQKCGYNFGEVIRILCENWQAGSLTYVDNVMQHLHHPMHHPIWGDTITEHLMKTILYKPNAVCTNFRDLI